MVVKPKYIVYAIAVTSLLGIGFHYRHVISERAELATQVLQLQQQRSDLQTALERERKAAEQQAKQQQEAQAALDNLRKEREQDEEGREWGKQLLPPAEVERLCKYLPQLQGC